MISRTCTHIGSLLVLVSITLVQAYSQSKDTVLNMMLSEPFFYNIILADDGAFYAGSSQGMLKIVKKEIYPYNHKIGYVTLSENGKPVLSETGVKYHRDKSFLHLLPYPEVSRVVYYAGNEEMFYLCSGGRLYIYNIMPYDYTLENHSIRSISKNLIGTYSGIYLGNRVLGAPAPTFLDGYIREYGDRAFICTPINMFILEKGALQGEPLVLGENCHIYTEPDELSVMDIIPSADGQYYYIATQDKLIQSDINLSKEVILFKHEFSGEPVGIISDRKEVLLFFSNEKLCELRHRNGKIKELASLDDNILDGLFFEDQLYLLTRNGLYRYNSANLIEKLSKLESAHTITQLSGTELIIGSDIGLFHYNLVTSKLSSIIKGIEFNRKALYKDGKSIFAGSINGLYKINVNDVPQLIKKANDEINLKSELSNTSVIIIIILVLILFVLIHILIKNSKKLKQAETIIEKIQVPVEVVTREKIEDYIIHNLPNASIKSILDEFKLSPRQLIRILQPAKPGAIIQDIRLKRVSTMRHEGKTKNEIAEATGLSLSYLKKLKI